MRIKLITTTFLLLLPTLIGTIFLNTVQGEECHQTTPTLPPPCSCSCQTSLPVECGGPVTVKECYCTCGPETTIVSSYKTPITPKYSFSPPSPSTTLLPYCTPLLESFDGPFLFDCSTNESSTTTATTTQSPGNNSTFNGPFKYACVSTPTSENPIQVPFECIYQIGVFGNLQFDCTYTGNNEPDGGPLEFQCSQTGSSIESYNCTSTSGTPIPLDFSCVLNISSPALQFFCSPNFPVCYSSSPSPSAATSTGYSSASKKSTEQQETTLTPSFSTPPPSDSPYCCNKYDGCTVCKPYQHCAGYDEFKYCSPQD